MPQIGTVLRSRYKIINILGSGGFGETYLAQDLDLPNQPNCVVKHLKPNSNPAGLQVLRRLFDSEAQVLYHLGNDNDQIPRLFAHFEEQGEFYLVQEFVDGEDLSKKIIPGHQLTEIEVTKLLQEILEVLVFVHKQNIIHRDIKPQNIMRRRDGKIVLIDFGAVKEVNTLMVNNQGQTISFSVAIGTAGYMPSEQAAGEPKLSSDVYAVGMLGIYSLTGIQPKELPKDPNNGEVIWRNWANVSEKLAEILDKMVRYHFRDRYPSAAEVLEALTSQPKLTPPTNLSRHRFLQTAGWLVAGFGLAIIGERLLFLPKSGNRTVTTPVTNEPIPPVTETPITRSSASPNRLRTFQFEVVTVDAKGKITNRRNREAKYFVEDLGNGVTLEMVQIPGGKFTMGSPKEEAERVDTEEPQHQVTVPSFFMGKYAVTQAQYEEIMETNPSRFKDEKKPVDSLSWDNAVEFCQKLSQKTGRIYRLPSEAEWEYACRVGTTTPFYCGENITTALVNYNGSEHPYGSAPEGEFRQQTTPVGNFPPNAFGLYDMHGNVWEWCQDHWHDNYKGAPTDGSAWIDDNNNKKSYRVLRGGSWFENAQGCRSARRIRFEANQGYDPYGFRVVTVVV